MSKQTSETATLDLQNYARIEGTELGEACSLLCELNSYSPYLSYSFIKALRIEIKAQLQNFEDFAVITKTEHTYTKTITELAWKETNN